MTTAKDGTNPLSYSDPSGLIRALPNDNVARVLATFPVDLARTYFLEALCIGRDPANGQYVTTKLRATVAGGPAPTLSAVLATYAAVTTMANPPTYTFALVGTQFRVTVTNPVAGAPCDVECYLAPTISS